MARFLPGHEYSIDWKIERGHYDPLTLLPYGDQECDLRERVQAERREEERRWTRSYFERLFGIRRASSRSPARGAEKETVREAADVTRFLDALGIRWVRRGDRVTFCCPFHGEKNPSASFSFAKKVWYCHSGCARGGDLFGFWAEANGCSFAEAVEAVHRL